MPLQSKQEAHGANALSLPFDSYAQVLRMLMPPINRVGFYDASGNALWSSDGVEEPEFRMHLDLVLARFTAEDDDEQPSAYAAVDQAEPIYLFAIRDDAQKLLGAIGLVCRELPASTAYRRREHVEKMLNPLIEIITHGWRAQAAQPATAAGTAAKKPTAPAPIMAVTPEPSSLPAILRRSLALATRSLDGAFGAAIAAERPFTLTHRLSLDESDLAVNSAIDTVRNGVLKYMRVRSGPLVSNQVSTGSPNRLPYKLLALPLRAGGAQLAAALIVFRAKTAPDFGSDDIALLAQIAAQVPAAMLSEWISGTSAAPSAEASSVETSAPSGADARVPPVLSAPATPRPDAAPIVDGPPKIVSISAARTAMTMDERVRLALRDNNFDLYVQKIAPLHDAQRATRYEVLLRMTDGLHLYTPKSFFAAAEQHELMPDVDEWVVRELLRTLRSRATSIRTKFWEFSINLSAQTMLTDRFSDSLLGELRMSPIPPGTLTFEVSEGDAIEHQYSLSLLANRLRDAGCRLALDNCRAGLRTFDTLRKWPVTCVKIDGSLVRNIATNFRYENQVRQMARMAHGLGIETVAECVENESVRERLLNMEIDYVQGFHFGQPQPLSTLFQ
jgi:EAL domain-containing protein (putative c-di-GMP-specific phosphodiesterase class I)